MNNLFSWINNELKIKGWSYAELARRSKLSKSAISNTINGTTKITWSFCAAIASAFQLPPEEVFRKAGLLKSTPKQAKNSELINIANNLPESDLELLNEFAKLLYQRNRK